MGKIRFLIFLTFLVGFGLVACTRSASNAPVATSTPLQDPIVSVYSKGATQQALSLSQTPGTGETGGGEGTPAAEAAAGEPTLPVATATPTEAPTAEPTQEMVVPDSYTLEKGEFPYCIARRFDIDAPTLLNANNLSNSGVFYAGLTLKIPKNASSFGGKRALLSHPTTYKAVSGDTFFSIACKFGDVWPEQIAEANGKGKKYEPSVGEEIQIP